MPEFQGKKAVALISGGLDSVVSLSYAVKEMEVRLALFFNYRQRALERERNAVMDVVTAYGIPFQEVDIGWLGPLAPEGLRKEDNGWNVGKAGELRTIDAVWVPNRNGVFLNIAAAYAEGYGCDIVVTGFNKEEAVDFPDNKSEFVESVNECLGFSTRRSIRVVSFTQHLSKREILLLGFELGAPLSAIWSCYGGGKVMCGVCLSCERLKTAIRSIPEGKRPCLEFGS